MSVFRRASEKTWTAKFMLNGKIHAKRASRTKLTAQQWEAEERKRIEAGPLETLTISFGSLAQRYLDHCRARMQQNTWIWYLTTI